MVDVEVTPAAQIGIDIFTALPYSQRRNPPLQLSLW
jgi:hypothetical protein